jgi:RNA polymerase sigma factor (sigma-70 family)
MTSDAPAWDAVSVFEGQRARLTRLAYRMLGALAEAEDAVQDAWLRLAGADLAAIRDPAAWLLRVTSRLCLDRQRAAKARREAYKGPWLPDPLVEEMFDDPVERAEEVSVAFLLALQRLSPLEHAVFLLHDVFDQEYAEVAETLDRSEVACRRLAARGSRQRPAGIRHDGPQGRGDLRLPARREGRHRRHLHRPQPGQAPCRGPQARHLSDRGWIAGGSLA